ncbi:DUF1295-domain-containing protein [Peniophora sp. CONT]|nr:DUF1295-domain-containing protein [Peniophora sp. CONT]
MSPLAYILEPTAIPALLVYPLKLCAATTFTTYVLSLLTGNVGQVDKIWLYMPTLYTAYWALLPLWPQKVVGPFYLLPYVPEGADAQTAIVDNYNPRALVIFGLTVTWMCRLTYNAHRRGLLSFSGEDYRWGVLRQQMSPWLFQVMNLTFIAIIQNVLLLTIALPTLFAVWQGPAALGPSDYLLGTLALLALAWEAVADNQQFSFHAWKHGNYKPEEHWPGARLAWTTADRARGFCTRGLWAWSRHPNYLAEQSFWCILNLIPLVAPEDKDSSLITDYDHTVRTLKRLAPCLSLCMLFYSSTDFSENISLSKYPEAYAAYKKRVAKLMPFLTPVHGVLVGLISGEKEKVRMEQLVYGEGALAAKSKSE